MSEYRRQLDENHFLEDEELLCILKDSNSEASKEIYRRYWKHLYLIAFEKLRSKDVAKELTGGTYALFPDITNFWRESNENNSEVVWDRQVVAVTMGSNYEQYGGPVWIDGVYYTWGNYCPTQELVDQFRMANGKSITDPASGYDPQHPYVNREKRFYYFIVYDGAPYKQDWMARTDTIYTRIDKVRPSKNQIDFGTDDVTTTGYYFKKKINPDKPRGGAASGQDFVYYRYAEILLNYAEAQNEAEGPDASVYESINLIRRRSKFPDLEAGLVKQP